MFVILCFAVVAAVVAVVVVVVIVAVVVVVVHTCFILLVVVVVYCPPKVTVHRENACQQKTAGWIRLNFGLWLVYSFGHIFMQVCKKTTQRFFRNGRYKRTGVILKFAVV